MKKPRIQRYTQAYLTPSPSPERELAPRPHSVLVDWEGASAMSTPMPDNTACYPAVAFYDANPPTLADILSNLSPPPWTLAAFMQYLSQNHCLETLEFTLDADRYRNAYSQVMKENASWMIRDGSDHVCSLWEKLMQAYIIPYAPREVNLPARVRDRLMGQHFDSVPPHPDELNEAVAIVYELMNDSVLLPFIEAQSPPLTDYHHMMQETLHTETRRGRSRSKMHVDAGFNSGPNSRSASSSADFAERDVLTDDSGSASSPTTEPMTPPTTPPSSEWTFSHSPGGFQRALTAHNNGWKRVGAKLGFSRKSRTVSRQSNATSEGGRSGKSASPNRS